jgi:hypothetical protein
MLFPLIQRFLFRGSVGCGSFGSMGEEALLVFLHPLGRRSFLPTMSLVQGDVARGTPGGEARGRICCSVKSFAKAGVELFVVKWRDGGGVFQTRNFSPEESSSRVCSKANSEFGKICCDVHSPAKSAVVSRSILGRPSFSPYAPLGNFHNTRSFSTASLEIPPGAIGLNRLQWHGHAPCPGN